MSKIVDVNKLVGDLTTAADDMFESGEERNEALTDRHSMDMINGTWLTKNIRPLTLLSLLLYWLVLLPVLQYMGVEVPEVQVKAVEYLSMTSFGFYFGSRGAEKVQVIKAKMERKRERREARRAKKDN